MALTVKDLQALRELVETIVDERLDEKLDEKLSHLPTKDEFYKETLKILKKLDNVETAMKLTTSRVSTHSDKIEKLKKIHPSYQHASL